MTLGAVRGRMDPQARTQWPLSFPAVSPVLFGLWTCHVIIPVSTMPRHWRQAAVHTWGAISCMPCRASHSAGGEQLAGISFPLVVLDEGSQATEPEALIPLTKVRLHTLTLATTGYEACNPKECLMWCLCLESMPGPALMISQQMVHDMMSSGTQLLCVTNVTHKCV